MESNDVSDGHVVLPKTTRRRRVEGGRQARHVVRVTPEEEGQLLALAGKHRVSIPKLLVEAALATDASETPTERRNAITTLMQLHRLLAADSRNLNQIARATNATGELQGELTFVLEHLRKVMDRIDDAIDGLGLS